MSRFDNIETQTLVDMLAQNTERLTKLFIRISDTREDETHKKIVRDIQAELRSRHNADYDNNAQPARDPNF
jgi:hypothetical protein